MLRAQREGAQAEVLITTHRDLRVVAGEALRKDQLLTRRERQPTASGSEADFLCVARRPQTVGTPGGAQLTGDALGHRRPHAANVAAGGRKAARHFRAARAAADEVRGRASGGRHRGNSHGSKGRHGERQCSARDGVSAGAGSSKQRHCPQAIGHCGEGTPLLYGAVTVKLPTSPALAASIVHSSVKPRRPVPSLEASSGELTTSFLIAVAPPL